MVVGAATVIIWEAGAFFGLYSIVPGFILSSIAIFVISNITYKKDGQTQVLFDDLERKFWIEVKDR